MGYGVCVCGWVGLKIGYHDETCEGDVVCRLMYRNSSYVFSSLTLLFPIPSGCAIFLLIPTTGQQEIKKDR